MLAMEFGLPVVPISIDGAFDVMPRFRKIPRWGTITLTIHKPIEPKADGRHDLGEVMAASERAIKGVAPRAFPLIHIGRNICNQKSSRSRIAKNPLIFI